MKEDQRLPRRWYAFVIGMAIVLAVCTLFGYAAAKSKSGSDRDCNLSDIELLGKYVFFDKISSPPRMACVTCHDPATGGTGSVSGVNLHQVAIAGANPHTVGNLKPPTNAYATFIIPFQPCNTGGLLGRNVCGGNFWNGRAEGNEFPPEFIGATKHIGEEIFYDNYGNPIDPVGEGVWEYATYFGATADQALNPPPNPVEQNIDRQAVCKHVKSAKYAPLYEEVWGVEIDCSEIRVDRHADDLGEDELPEYAFDISFKRLMLAVCAWQASYDLNSFTSRRDKSLRAELACACDGGDVNPNYPGDDICGEEGLGRFEVIVDPSVCNDPDYIDSPGVFPLVGLTEQENYGHDLFYATILNPLNVGTVEEPVFKVSNCAFCHSDIPNAFGVLNPDTGDELLQLYAADDYHNIGMPRNPEIPVTFDANGDPIDPDLGLAGHEVVDELNDYPPGFFKTPTLRNVDKRKGKGFIKAYTHNGWFKSLESIVHFYNTAAVGFPTANSFGVTPCPEGVETEKEALANNCWPEPAYGGGAIPFLVGNLGLTLEDEAALVAYLKTLTDEYTAKAPKPYKQGD
jgi:cytochrome c peroxidase